MRTQIHFKIAKNTLRLAVILICIVISIGLFASNWMADLVDNRMRENFLSKALLIGEVDVVKQLGTMKFTLDEKDTPLHLLIRKQLRTFANSLQRSWSPAGNYIGIYSMKYSGNKLVFGPESIPENDHMASIIGTVYEQPPPELLKVFATAKPAVVGPYTDEYGTFISAFVPLLDSNSGNVAAVMGIDIESSDWKKQIFLASTPPVLITILLSVLLALLFVFYHHNRETRNILRDREMLYKLLIENAPDAVFLIAAEGNNSGCIIATNNSAASMHGYSVDELTGMNITKLFIPGNEQVSADMLQQLVSKKGTYFETEHLRKDGSVFPVEIKAQLITLNQSKCILTNDRDISDRKQAEERERQQAKRIAYLAYHDALTDLPNRVLFQDHLGLALAQSDREKTMVAVLFSDLDNFKIINDSLGHAIGDELLRHVSNRLRKSLREGDTVARFGGDEFVILLPRISAEKEITQVATKVINMLSGSIEIEGHDLNVTTSIGISIFPTDGGDIETLLKHADIALYSAKSQGGNRYQFYDAAIELSSVV